MATRHVEFDQNVHTLGPASTASTSSTSDHSWISSTSSGDRSVASTSRESYQTRSTPPQGRNAGAPSPFSPEYSYQRSQRFQNSGQIEYYPEDDDDDHYLDDDSYSLYINESGGYVSRYPPPGSKASNGYGRNDQSHHPDDHHSSATHHLHPTTLYRSGSVSIVNCEYKLKEKYPHLVYLLFFVVIYILLILLGASLFVLFEAKTEVRLRDQILHQQQLFLEQNACLDPKDLKQFIKTVMIANDKGANLAKLNELVALEEARLLNETLSASNSSTSSTVDFLPEFAQEAIQSVEKAFRKPPPSESDSPASKRSLSKRDVSSKSQNRNAKAAQKEAAESRDELAGEVGSDRSPNDDASIQITKHAKPIRVPLEMANWEFLSSLTYVTTVVTTIGYGHVTPATSEGKILTLVYGAIAIPATLLFFSIIISAIRDGPVKAFEILMIKLLSRYTHITLLKIRFLHLILVTLMLFLMLILLPSFVFLQLEPDWTFLDSFYYCFITITTVGLGDYVPAQNVLTQGRPFYLIGTILYMYFGLCMIMLWIALVLRIPYFNFKTFLVIEEPEIAEEKISNERTRLLPENSTHTYASIY